MQIVDLQIIGKTLMLLIPKLGSRNCSDLWLRLYKQSLITNCLLWQGTLYWDHARPHYVDKETVNEKKDSHVRLCTSLNNRLTPLACWQNEGKIGSQNLYFLLFIFSSLLYHVWSLLISWQWYSDMQDGVS
jgi:hypothetical protein